MENKIPFSSVLQKYKQIYIYIIKKREKNQQHIFDCFKLKAVRFQSPTRILTSTLSTRKSILDYNFKEIEKKIKKPDVSNIITYVYKKHLKKKSAF